jgi:hypothetical protein
MSPSKTSTAWLTRDPEGAIRTLRTLRTLRTRAPAPAHLPDA